MIKFYDSASRKFPQGATHVALYYDGLYAAPMDEPFPYRRWITIEGGAATARYAGIADFEHLNPVYDDSGRLRDWTAERKAIGKRARIYCNRSDAHLALEQTSGLPRLFWIATLDNHQWTPAELIADLKNNFGADISESELWANQYAGGTNADYDTSNLFGDW
ncbi:MAG: hypothetical protein ABSB01_20135 [Streptosporangiaceae bacterium]|jgi:hypothetical protein